MSLNKNEKRIFAAIKENPYLSQQALAERMGLSRSYVADILSTLVRKGYLLGRAYVLNPEKVSFLCIGRDPHKPHMGEQGDAAPGARPSSSQESDITRSPSLQVAKGFKQLQERVVVLSTGSVCTKSTRFNDTDGPFLEATYVDNEMAPDWVYKNSALLRQAGAVVVDSDLPQESLEILFSIARKGDITLTCIAPFGTHTQALSKTLAGVTLFVATVDQSQSSFSSSETANEQMTVLLRHSLKNGAEHVCLLDHTGSLYYGSYQYGLMKVSLPELAQQPVAPASQAALVAGMLHQYRQTKDLKRVLTAGLINTTLITHAVHTDRDDLNPHMLEKAIHESDPLLFEGFV